jgi:hypothetical protein
VSAYDEYDPSRAWPTMPDLTDALLSLPEPPDLGMAAELFYGLDGMGGPNDLLAPYDVGNGPMPSYFDLGVGSMPGVKVEGL